MALPPPPLVSQPQHVHLRGVLVLICGVLNVAIALLLLLEVTP